MQHQGTRNGWWVDSGAGREAEGGGAHRDTERGWAGYTTRQGPKAYVCRLALEHLEHLECSQQPHIQGRVANK